jgi:serine/threonine protein kinase
MTMDAAAMRLPPGDDVLSLSALANEEEVLAGAVLDDRWLLVRELGRGSQCIVFEMMDLSAVARIGPDSGRLPRAVLKILRPSLADDPTARAQLTAEAAALAAAAHSPGVARCREVREAFGRPALVLDRSPGQALSRVLARRGLDRPSPHHQWQPVLSRLAATLCALHTQSVVHGDLKPGNVLIGPGWEPTLIDFGAARTGAPSSLETVSPVTATPAWSSPALAHRRTATTADDLYAFALLTARLINGRHPFGGHAPAAALNAGISAAPVRAAPPSLRRLVAHVLNAPNGAHGLHAAVFAACLGAPRS